MLKKLKIDWTNFLILESSRSYDDKIKFDISPKDFLSFAKQDFNLSNRHGMINALCNAKRAIDCQVDWILVYLGYDYLKFNQEAHPNIKDIIDQYESENEKLNDIPFKLKFIQAMGIAPLFLVSKIRLLRNKLEHEYFLPKKEEVKEALEVAELFINATYNVVYSSICTEISFGSNFDSEKLDFIEEHYYVEFNVSTDKSIHVMILGLEERIKEIITVKDLEYVFMIKAMVSHDFYYLTKAFNQKIEKKYIKYTGSLFDEEVIFP
jgi:hypothetical protein